MSKKIIRISVKDRYALTEGNPVIICGNSGYSVEFTFDPEWDEYEVKTARFVYVKRGKVKHQDVVFAGTTAVVPILSNIQAVHVGVFAADLSTTTPARIPCRFSVRCGTGAPEDPTPSQYDQIMTLLRLSDPKKLVRLNQGTENAGRALVVGEDGVVRPQTDIGDIYKAQATADNAVSLANNAQATADNAVSLANNAQATADNAVPAPATASVGQTIKVSAVDENGKPTAWEAAGEWDIHYKVNIPEALPGGFEINEINGNTLKLKEMWAFVKLQSAVDSAWLGCRVTTDNSGVILSDTTAPHGGVNANANVYAYFVYHAMILPNSTRAICQIMAAKGPSGTVMLEANHQWLNNWLEYNNINYITGLKCTNNLGAGTAQGYGTEVEIWGTSI